jgi:geranylgeranyl diphosphate synthase, type II
MFDPKEMQADFHEKRLLIDQALQHCMEPLKEKTSLFASISYSLFSGGKRIRPLLLLSSYETMSAGSSVQKALLAACAIEFVHCYSLIHDDLPCMDNSDYRRNKPSNHKIYGDDIALLAGDALLTHAFLLLSNAEARSQWKDHQIVQLVQCLSSCSGILGMVEGQAFELIQQDMKMENLHYIDEHKTAALFSAALTMGGIIADAPAEMLDLLGKTGRAFGHAFQIADDIEDYSPQDNASNIVKLIGMSDSKELFSKYMNDVDHLLDEISPSYPHPSLRDLIQRVKEKSGL